MCKYGGMCKTTTSFYGKYNIWNLRQKDERRKGCRLNAWRGEQADILHPKYVNVLFFSLFFWQRLRRKENHLAPVLEPRLRLRKKAFLAGDPCSELLVPHRNRKRRHYASYTFTRAVICRDDITGLRFMIGGWLTKMLHRATKGTSQPKLQSGRTALICG